MTNKPISEVIAEVKEAAELSTALNLDTAESVDIDDDGYIHCPMCSGDGGVHHADYCNIDHVALGVQFYGIGEEFGLAEKYFRAVSPANVMRLIDHIAALEQQLAAERARMVKLPDLNAALIEILGRPNFHCSPVAQCLRIGGAEIPHKSENEQAACIHWMLGLYLEHGESWMAVARDELKRIAARMPVEGE